MYKIILKEIAKIESGRSFRSKVEDDPSGDCVVIQMKDVSSEFHKIIGEPHRISVNEVNSSQLLQDGDLLFVAKGNNNFALTYRSNKQAVAVSFFFIIRPDINKINSEYLAWFLNSPEAQSYFHEMRDGGSVGNIRKEALENIEIPLPDMQTQLSIGTISYFWKNEKEMTLKSLKQKEFYYSKLYNKLMQKTQRPTTPHDIGGWYNICTHSNYYPANVELKKSITIDGQKTNEINCTFWKLNPKNVEFKQDNGSTISLPQAFEWEYILLKDLKIWNDVNTPSIEKERTVLKHLSHDLIKKITLKDTRTGKIIISKENN